MSLLGVSACGADSESSVVGAGSVTSGDVDQEQEPDIDDEDEHEDEDVEHEDEDGHDDDEDEHEDEDEHDDEHEDENEDDDDEHDDESHSSGGLGAHEHGAAEMSVAWIEADVVIELFSPTFNLFGFEYQPETDSDLALAADRTDALTADGIIEVNAGAGCRLADPVSTETEYEGSHSEMTATWLFVCDNPDEISQVDATKLFAEFPSFQDIDAEWVSETEQSSAELSPASPTLRLRS